MSLADRLDSFLAGVLPGLLLEDAAKAAGEDVPGDEVMNAWASPDGPLQRCTVLLSGPRPQTADSGVSARPLMLVPVVTTITVVGRTVDSVSLLLASADHKVVYHMDSQHGATMKHGKFCLLGHGSEAIHAVLRGVEALVSLTSGYTDISSWPIRRVKVPLQRHLDDSAAFACTNALYTLATLPSSIPDDVAGVSGAYRDTDVEVNDAYPGYMTREWYPPKVPERVTRNVDDATPYTLPSDRLERQIQKRLERLERRAEKKRRLAQAQETTARRPCRRPTPEPEPDREPEPVTELVGTKHPPSAEATGGPDTTTGPANNTARVVVGDRVCAHCGNCTPTLKRCSGCQQAYYCTANCQLEHWPAHKAACQRLSSAVVLPGATTDTRVVNFHSGVVPADTGSNSNARSYSKWEPNGRGGYSKMLSSSDLLKLRLKGE